MNKILITSPFLLFLTLFSSVFVLTACNDIINNVVWPRTDIISVYTSPRIGEYKIRSISILPITPDDTTDTGTYYSTNHLINSLEDKFPEIEFVVADIDTAIAIDSLAIPKAISSIEKRRRLYLREFYNSELGYDVKKDSADAIIIGLIDSTSKKGGFLIRDFRLNKTRIISCGFTYYLISMRDGRVLWKGAALGEAGYFYDGVSEIYPPIDRAISYGIDLLLDTIPLDSM